MVMLNVEIETPANNVVKVWAGSKTVLFSHKVPVALWERSEGEIKRYALKTAAAPSARHLNQFGPKAFLQPGDHFEEVTEEQLAELIGRRGS